jgi:alpha-tubulin suppressor-like RCC1 family protein
MNNYQRSVRGQCIETMYRRALVLLVVILGYLGILVKERAATASASPVPAASASPTSGSSASTAGTRPTDEQLSKVAQRWGLDFLDTSACRDKTAGRGIVGFGTSFEYKVPRTGTLMSALGLAAQIVRLACLAGPSESGDDSFYCGTLVAMFMTDRGAIDSERTKLRDFVKRFGAATRSERVAVVQAVVAQFEQCGRQDELRRIAAVMDQGLTEYDNARDELGLKTCRSACDPRGKADWGLVGRIVSGTWRETRPSTDACFKNCSNDFRSSHALIKFIHRRVLQGISIDEMRELTGLLTKPDALAKNEIIPPGSALRWLRCAVGQTWDGKGCTGVPQRLDWKSAATSCPAGYRVPTAREFKVLLGCPTAENPDEKSWSCQSCAASNSCSTWLGHDAESYWFRSPWRSYFLSGHVSLASGRFDRSGLGSMPSSRFAVRCVRWWPPTGVAVQESRPTPPTNTATAFEQTKATTSAAAASGATNVGFNSIFTGVTHTCAIHAQDKTLQCWGTGNLGDGTGPLHPTPTDIGHDTWSAIAAGSSRTCGIKKADQKLYCWGYNRDGQLGDGTESDLLVPTRIGDDSWAAVTAGGMHFCGITAAGSIYCWGNNRDGQLGDGTIVNKTRPTKIGKDEWFAIAAGSSYTCAIKKTDRKLYCWGSNYNGQFGNGESGKDADKHAPTKTSDDAWSDVVAGLAYTCGVKTADKKYYCWGDNRRGQLGDGTTTSRTTPTVIGDGAWTTLAAGDSHICGTRKADNKVYCWGANGSGQLGDGTTQDKGSPTKIGDDPWSAIAAGDSFTCGTRATDGQIYCWGRNNFGQLGNGGSGYNNDKTIPTPVLRR